MLKISFSKTVKSKITVFTDFLKEYYRKFYNDSGLPNEDDIINMYVIITDRLTEEIIDEIENTIKKWVFWEIIDRTSDSEKSKLVIFVRSYNVVCYCKKYTDDKNNIYIEDIFIKS